MRCHSIVLDYHFLNHDSKAIKILSKILKIIPALVLDTAEILYSSVDGLHPPQGYSI